MQRKNEDLNDWAGSSPLQSSEVRCILVRILASPIWTRRRMFCFLVVTLLVKQLYL